MKPLTTDGHDNRHEASVPLANSGNKLREDGTFSVWQNDQYRWVQEGDAIQSVMSRSNPADLVLPNHRYMFVALALADMRADSSIKVLNLGFGLGAIERRQLLAHVLELGGHLGVAALERRPMLVFLVAVRLQLLCIRIAHVAGGVAHGCVKRWHALGVQGNIASCTLEQ